MKKELDAFSLDFAVELLECPKTTFIMKKLRFYLIAIFGNILFHILVEYRNANYQFENCELSFFPLAVLFVCLLYVPLCLLFAVMFAKFKINAHVIDFPLSYSLFPFVLPYILGIKAIDRDWIICGLFVVENVIILCASFWGRIEKNRHK